MKYYISIAILFLIIYLILSSIKSSGCCGCEGFTPKVRQAFRPYFRNTKNYYEGFFNNTKNHVNRFLRNIGLF